MSNISFVLFKVSTLHITQIKRYRKNEAKKFVWWLSVGQIYKRTPPACMFHATFAQILSIKSDQLNSKPQHPPNSHQLLRNPFPKSFGHFCLRSITSPVAYSGFYFFNNNRSLFYGNRFGNACRSTVVILVRFLPSNVLALAGR